MDKKNFADYSHTACIFIYCFLLLVQFVNFQMRFTQNSTCVALDVVASSPSIIQVDRNIFFCALDQFMLKRLKWSSYDFQCMCLYFGTLQTLATALYMVNMFERKLFLLSYLNEYYLYLALVNTEDLTLEFLFQTAVDALMAVELGQNEYLLVFSSKFLL